MYSVQSCCLTATGSWLADADLVSGLKEGDPADPWTGRLAGREMVLVDCRLVIRTTTCRTPESGKSGIWVARSETTRTPVKYVAEVRLYFSSVQVIRSWLGRLAIRALKLLERPVQQILRMVLTSPLFNEYVRLVEKWTTGTELCELPMWGKERARSGHTPQMRYTFSGEAREPPFSAPSDGGEDLY